MEKNTIMKLPFVILIILLSFSTCKTIRKPVADPLPIHQTFTIDSKQVNETRTINVFTPAGYAAGNDSLPVLYMPDGGIKEDFPHIANTIDKLIRSKSIPPIILVGIENTQRRRDLTGPTQVEEDKKIAPVVGESKQFRDFIREELFAEINNRFKTNGTKALLGESLAGLFVMETFLTQPAMFDYYIAMDPSLWWNNAQLVKSADSLLPNFTGSQKKLWFAGSGTEGIYVHTEAIAQSLKNKKVPNLQYFYSPEPKEAHGTIFRATKEKALIWIFGTPAP